MTPISGAVADEVDVAVLKDVLGSNGPAVRVLLTDYLASLRRQASGIRADLAAGDLRKVQRDAHQLKSASSYVGATHLSRLCAEMESACKAGDPRVAEALMSGFNEAVSKVDSELTAILEGRRAGCP